MNAMSAPAIPGFGVYVHWPFCLSKCPYCDFNSHVRTVFDEERWLGALLREFDHYAALTRDRVVTTIFFGGGTPSLMAPRSVAKILERIAARWSLAEDPEVTLEANPNSAEVARFRELRAAGVNRVSIGIQSLDDAALRFLGRAHDASEGRKAIAAATAAFDRTSFDLIYARPGQTMAAWREELNMALGLVGEHLSVYQLTFEPGTRFEQLRLRGDIVPLDDDVATEMFDFTQDALRRAGLAAYEVSNHARGGAQSRHNLIYWRYEDYLGLGPGAHGRVTIDGSKHALRAARSPEAWMDRVERLGHGTDEDSLVAPADAAREALLMGMRLSEGIDPARFRRVTGIELDDALDPRGLERVLSGGFAVLSPAGGLVATRAGRRVLNALIAEIAR